MFLPTWKSNSWVKNRTWCCLAAIIRTYFIKNDLDVYTDTDATPILDTSPSPFYLSNLPLRIIPWRKSNIASIIIAKNFPETILTGRRGRTVFVSDDLSDVLSMWFLYKLVDIVVLIENRAYTWFPYRRDQCRNQPDLILIDTCNEECEWSGDLFPKKAPINFSGCPVTYTSIHWPPNTYIIDGEFRGRDVKVMEALAKSFGFSVSYIESPHLMPADNVTHPTFAMELLANGTVDFAFGTSIITLEGFRWAEPLPAFRSELTSWIFPTPKQKPLLSGIYSGFPPLMQILLMLVVISMLTVLFLISRIKSDRWYWLDVLACLLASPISSKYTSQIIRILFLLFQVYSLHLAWFYQATILGNLFAVPMEKQVETPEEAVAVGLIPMIHPYLIAQFNRSKHKNLSKVVYQEDGKYVKEDYTRSDYDLIVKEKKAFFLAMMADVEDLRQKYSAIDLYEGVDIAHEHFEDNYVSAYGVRGALLTELYTEKMLHLVESGIFLYWTSLEPAFAPIEDFVPCTLEEVIVLDLEILQGAFLLHGALIIFSSVVFLSEYLYGKYIH